MHASLLESEQRFRYLVEAVQDYAIYMLDPDGCIATWNIGAQRNKGYEAREIVGAHFRTFFLPEEAESGMPERMLAEARIKGSFRGEGWRRRKNGTHFWASVQLSAIRDETGELIGFAKVTRDLTERKLRDEALRDSRKALQEERDRLRITLLSIADGVVCTDAEGRITLMNAAAEAMTGWSKADAQGTAVERVLRLVEASAVFAGDGGYAVPSGNTLRDSFATLIARDGGRRDVQISVAAMMAEGEKPLGAVLVFQDVTRLRVAQREIEFNANHDALTLLPNRRCFEQELARVLEGACSTAGQSTVCFLDLDRFKIINDTAGHPAGDALLRQVAGVLRRNVRSVDTVARLGGDEFAIILKACSPEQAQPVLVNIAEALAALEFRWQQRVFPITVSIGVAAIDEDATPTSIMKQADVACYAAKHAGRNRIRTYRADQGDEQEHHRQIHVAAEIRQALREDRFVLYAQKIADLGESGEQCYEILVRMLTGEGAILSPAQFIPSAERYDLMAEVDRWVVDKALKLFRAMVAAAPTMHLSLNLSANSLNDPRLLSFLVEAAQRHGVPMDRLTFEITESALINNLAEATVLIKDLRRAGSRIALDDFGIGLCSFNYLRSFGVDIIKIDGAFVRNMQSNALDHAIVGAIANIAQQCDARTVAEYVEDESMIPMLRDLRINLAQGYAIGRPEPFEEVLARHGRCAPAPSFVEIKMEARC